MSDGWQVALSYRPTQPAPYICYISRRLTRQLANSLRPVAREACSWNAVWAGPEALSKFRPKVSRRGRGGLIFGKRDVPCWKTAVFGLLPEKTAFLASFRVIQQHKVDDLPEMPEEIQMHGSRADQNRTVLQEPFANSDHHGFHDRLGGG